MYTCIPQQGVHNTINLEVRNIVFILFPYSNRIKNFNIIETFSSQLQQQKNRKKTSILTTTTKTKKNNKAQISCRFKCTYSI